MTPEQAEKLRAPFAADEIELLPKPYRKDAEKGKCKECDGFHGLPAVHLSYVGHAGVTMRLNDVDPLWTWEPMARTEVGTPMFTDGGLWITLTVCGHTRIGFGDAAGKSGPNAVKEAIGDAIRNAAMRFGVGTYLWSKSEKAQAQADRHGADEQTPAPESRPSAYQRGSESDRPAGAEGKITRKQLGKLHACLTDYGLGGAEHREAALAYYADVIGRDVESSKDLTVAEASKVIDQLVKELGKGTDVTPTPPEPDGDDQ